MAITILNPAETGERYTGAFQLGGGLLLRIVDLSCSDVSADVPSGVLDLGALEEQLGFHRILAVLDWTVRSPGTPDTMRTLQAAVWHPASKTLTFCETGTYTIDPIEPDTDLINGDVIRLVLIGV